MKYSHKLLPPFLLLTFSTIMFTAKGNSLSDSTLNVKSFGAVGNGLTNDSSAFQKGITYASRHHDKLFVPKGIYIIANLLLYPNTYLQGEGSGSILKLRPSVGNKQQCLIFDKNSSNITVDNIFLDANSENNKGNMVYCAWTRLSPGQIHDLTFSHCTFTGSNGYGALFLIGTARSIIKVTVTHCNFFNTGTSAMHLRGVTNMLFSDNSISSWGQIDKSHPGISLQSQECQFLVFRNNTFKNKDASYFAIESAGAYVRNSQFINNIFDGNNLDASGISGYFSHCLFKGNRHVSGGGTHRSGYELVGDFDTVCNTFIDNGNITLGCTPPFGVEKGGNGYLVIDDTVTTHTTSGMCIGIGGTDTVKNATIENNILDNRNSIGSAPVILIGARGLVKNILIMGNTLYGSASACIRFNVTSGTTAAYSNIFTCENISILKNTFIGPKGISIDHPNDWRKVEFINNDFRRTNEVGLTSKSLPNGFRMAGNQMPISN